EHARNRIARIIFGKPCDRGKHPLANPRRTLRIPGFKFDQSFAQTDRIQLIDGKHAVATLRTPGLAGQPLAAFLERIRQRSIDNLDQFPISRWSVAWHVSRLTWPSKLPWCQRQS